MNHTDFTPVASLLNERAKQQRPANEGDWYNEQGLLMCGKCNAPLEFILTADRLKPFPEDATPEQLFYMRQSRDRMVNKKYRIICKCVQAEREAYKQKKQREALEERFNFCYGNSMHLARTTWTMDDGRNEYASATLRRYVSKFDEMREKNISLLLTGKQESGKTFYARCMLNNIMTNGYQARQTTIHGILSNTSPYISYQLVINAMLEADIILCDDVDETSLTGKPRSVLEALIGTTVASGIPLIVCTRLEGSALDELKTIFKSVQISIGKAVTT